MLEVHHEIGWIAMPPINNRPEQPEFLHKVLEDTGSSAANSHGLVEVPFEHVQMSFWKCMAMLDFCM